MSRPWKKVSKVPESIKRFASHPAGRSPLELHYSGISSPEARDRGGLPKRRNFALSRTPCLESFFFSGELGPQASANAARALAAAGVGRAVRELFSDVFPCRSF